MLLSLIYFLPCFVSLLWFFSFLLKQKSYRQKLFFYAEGTSVIFYAILAVYLFPTIDYDTMVRMEVVCIPFGVLFPAFLIAYMYILCFEKKLNDKLQYLLFIPAIIMGVAVGLLNYIIGFDQASEVSRQFASKEGLTGTFDTPLNHLYCFFTSDFFEVLLAGYILIMIALCLNTLRRHGYKFGDVYRFFFQGKSTYSSRTIAVMFMAELAIMVMMLALGGVYFSEHMVLGIISMTALSAAKHLVAYLEFYSQDNKLVTLHELSHLQLFAEENQPAQAAEGETEVEAADVVVANEVVIKTAEEASAIETKTIHPSITVGQIKMDKRIEQFRKLMEEDKLWMDENLTSQTICEAMDIGKSTLSVMISQYYDSTFRDLVNKYRIDEAIAFMKANPKATQESIALHCGFKNAQYFNTIFKKHTGETPAMWLASASELGH